MGVGALNVSVDPVRSAKTIETVNSVLSMLNRTAPVSTMLGLETPQLFNGAELASLIDQILTKLAQDSSVNFEDVAASFKLGTGNEAITVSGIQDKAVRTLVTSLQIKLKTSQSIVTELGRKLDKVQRNATDLSSCVATLEMERASQNAGMEKLKLHIKELELRAASAEAAINLWDQSHQHIQKYHSKQVDHHDAGMESDYEGGRTDGELSGDERDFSRQRQHTAPSTGIKVVLPGTSISKLGNMQSSNNAQSGGNIGRRPKSKGNAKILDAHDEFENPHEVEEIDDLLEGEEYAASDYENDLFFVKDTSMSTAEYRFHNQNF
jgi:hypothetical protein